VKTGKKNQMQRLTKLLLSGAAALLLVVGLSLLLSRFQAVAQPTEVVPTDLTVQKEVSAAYAAPGDTLRYTITINNNSTSPIDAQMTDELPAGLINVSDWSALVGQVGFENGVITWSHTIGALSYDRITFRAQIAPDTTATEIENTAQVTGTGALITDAVKTKSAGPLDNDGTYKAADRELTAPGDLLTYTLVLNNNSDVSDALVQVTDPLHPLLTYVTDSVTVVPSGTGTLLLPTTGPDAQVFVERGTAATVTFQARVSDAAGDGVIITNTATISDGSGSIERSAAVTVDRPPTSQTRSPDHNTLITQRGVWTISGIAWDGDNSPPFPEAPLLNPIANEGGNNWYYVTWESVPDALSYVLQEDDNPYFADPTNYDPATSPKYITGKTPGTYYYRVKARNVSGESRWSNIESVVVPSAQASGSSSAAGVAAVTVTPLQVAANDSITVWVRVGTTDTWKTVPTTPTDWGGWEWSYDWTLPEVDSVPYAIQTRATDAAGNVGEIDTITVTVRNKDYFMYMPLICKRWPPYPDAPVLNPIGEPDEDGNYTVDWEEAYLAEIYTLQEDDNANFTTPETRYIGTSTYWDAVEKDPGTYYYRVRATNSWGNSLWSNVESVEVPNPAYRNDFTGSGENNWPIRRTSLLEGDEWHGTWTLEKDGSMYILMNDRWDFAIASPMVEAPSPPYVVETKAKFHDAANLVAYGVIFGAGGGSPCPAYRETGCFEHYYRLEVIWYGDEAAKAGFKRIDSHEADKGHGRGKELIDYQNLPVDPNGWHTWKFVVEEDGIDIYINGVLFGSVSDTSYINEPYFGIYASANEYKPAIGRFDYFYVYPK